MHPKLKINSFISDSASDNYPTYELLNRWDISAIIAFNPKNKGNNKYPKHLSLDDNGVPLCPAGNKMISWGFDPDRCRMKWRCPRVLGKAILSTTCASCSPSKYGRTIHIKPSWNLRFFTRIPRASDLWKLLFKQRTAAERINNRILNHYNLKNSRSRGKKRIAFHSALAAINIHLDAWLDASAEQLDNFFNLILAIYTKLQTK